MGETTNGTVLAVGTANIGDELDADAAAGSTSITITDAADFAESGGTLSINGQLTDYLDCDDETGVMTLVDALVADAFAGDAVYLADPSGALASEMRATVQVVGSLDSDEPIEAVIAHPIVPLLPEGIRDPGTGESVTLQLLPGEEWQLVNVHGRKPDFDKDNAHYNALAGLSRMSVSFDVPDVTTWTSGGFSDWTVDEVVGDAIRIRAGTAQIGMFEAGIYALTLTLGVGGMDAASPDCSIRADASLGWTAMATPYIACGMRGGDTNFAVASASVTYFHPGDGSETGVAIEVNNLDTVNVDGISVTLAVQQVVR